MRTTFFSLLLASVTATSAFGDEPVTTATQAPAPATTASAPAPVVPTIEPITETPVTHGVKVGDTTLGGYGEVHFNKPRFGAGTADLHRFVIFIGHEFSEKLRFVSETEIEHANTEVGGEIEMEQAYIDYSHDEKIGLRGGMLLMPVSLINLRHEPPTFNGVERPVLDTAIIPATWSELGAGIYGRPVDMLSYTVYAVTPLNAGGFGGDEGIREGRQHGGEVSAPHLAGVARLEARPIEGLGVALSGYTGAASQAKFRVGAPVRVNLAEADVQYMIRGFEVRGQFAAVNVGGANRLSRAKLAAAGGEAEEEEKDEEEEEAAGPVGQRLQGWYAEAGYNVFQEIFEEQALVAFYRHEDLNPFAKAPRLGDREVEEELEEEGTRVETVGLTYRPIAQIAVKGDVQYFNLGTERRQGHGFNQVNLGLGWHF